MPYDSDKSKSKTATDKILQKVQDNFESCLNHPTWVDWRKNSVKCNDYKENRQWTSDELKALEERGQPPTVNNQISVTVNRMVGQFVKQRSRTAFKGRNPQDKPTADVLSDLFLFIRQNNDLEFEEKDMAEDGFTGGFGCLKACVSYDDTFQPNIEMKALDSLTVFPDPYSRRYDWNQDANFISEAIWMDLEDLEELYPDYSKKIRASFKQFSTEGAGLTEADRIRRENWIDQSRERFRLIEQWYKTKRRQSVCIFADGNVLDKETNELKNPLTGVSVTIDKKAIDLLKQNVRYEEYDRVVHTLNMAVFCHGVLLEHKETERQYFPYIPYFVNRKKSGEPYSLIFIALQMQDAINKRESKALDLFTRAQTAIEKGAVTDLTKFSEERAKPDGVMEVNAGALSQSKVQFLEHVEMAQGQLAMHNMGKEDFRRITGINPDAMGEKSEVRSGIGIARKQAMTDVIIAPIFDNFRRTRAIEGRVILELIQQHFTQPKIFYITDNLNAPKSVALEEQHLEAIKQAKYDVVVEDAPDTTTMQEEQLAMLGQILPQILPFGPVWGRIMFQMSDIRNKEEILQLVEQASQPPPDEPKIAISAQLDALQPVERAAIWMKMGMPEVASAVMQEQPPTAAEQKGQTDLMREHMKQSGEKGRQDGEMVKTEMDVQAKMATTTMDIQKKQMELGNAAAKHQMEMEKLRANGSQGTPNPA